VANVVVGPQPPGYDFPVLCAVEMQPDAVNEAFKKVLDRYGIACFTAPLQIGSVRPKADTDSSTWKTLSFSELTAPNERIADTQSYVFWVKQHFKVRQDGSFKPKAFDSRMTVPEAMLYHLYWLWHYSYRYVGHHYSAFHQCNGSKGRNGIRFDLQDIKVCLD
jgi:hypothetical protein